MTRYRRYAAIVCIGLVLFAAFMPGVAAPSVGIVLDPVWKLFVPQSRVLVPLTTVHVNELTRALIAPVVSRPPPHFA